MEEAKRRADALARQQKLPAAPDYRMMDSKTPEAYQIRTYFPNHREVEIIDLEQPEKFVKIEGEPHELSEKQWTEISKAFQQMPIDRYEDIRKRDKMRELLTAKKEKKPVNSSMDPDTKALFDEWHKKYALRLEPVNPYQVPYRKLDFKGGDLDRDAILREVTKILGYKPLLTKDGYVIIGRQAYGLYEAIDVAKVAAAYRKIYGRVLPSLPYPITPPDQVLKGKEQSVYPDVTEVMNQHLKDIVQDVAKSVHDPNPGQYLGNTLFFFVDNFQDNALYDMQVNYGLPGQQLPEGVYFEKIGEYQGYSIVKTVDQRAIYRGKVVHAGYLSNYAYGYAVAAGNWFKGTTDSGAFFAGLMNKEIKIPDLDKPYYHAGYEAFWADHPEYNRTKVQH
jgi:hypothetical protein